MENGVSISKKYFYVRSCYGMHGMYTTYQSKCFSFGAYADHELTLKELRLHS